MFLSIHRACCVIKESWLSRSAWLRLTAKLSRFKRSIFLFLFVSSSAFPSSRTNANSYLPLAPRVSSFSSFFPSARCSALSLSCLYHPPPAVDTNAEAYTSTAHLELKRPIKATGSRPRIPAILTSQQQAAIASEAHNNASSPPPFSEHSPQNPPNLTTSTHPSSRSSSNSTGSRAPASGSGSSSSSSSSHPTSTTSYNSAVFPSCLQPAPRPKQSYDQQTFQQGLNQYSHPSYHNDHQDPSPGLNGNADDASSFFLPPHLLQQPAHPPQPYTKAESPACYVPHLQGMFEPFTNNTSTDGADSNSMNARLYAYDSPMGSGSAAGSKASVEVDVDLAGISGYGMGVGGDMEITTGLSELYGKDDGGQAFLVRAVSSLLVTYRWSI
jgi:hypothetical protein